MDIILDNSALSLLSCKRKFQLTVLEGRKPPGNQFSDFGNAFHKAVELIDQGLDASAAYHEATKDVGRIDKLQLLTLLTCFKATQKLPPAITIQDKPAIEFKFKWFYGSYVTEQGKKVDIWLCGTIDRIYLDGETLVFLDFKTAADYSDSSQKSKQEEYVLAFQLPWYVWNMLKSGLLPQEYIDKINNHQYRIEILLAFYTPSPPVFKKVTHGPFNDHFLHHEIPLIINNKIKDAINITQLGNQVAPHDGMTVYKACTYCAFRAGCLHMGSEKEIEFVSRFDKVTYDPLTFR